MSPPVRGAGRHRLVAALVAVWLLVPACLAAARWPRWWTWIAPEETPMTWLQSVVLVLAATGSLLVAYVMRRTGAGPHKAWWLLGAGFAALAFDERFAIHERVRDGVLAPRGVAIPFLPWVAPGDFLLLAVGLVGLALLPMVWRALGADVASRRALIVGVVLAAVAVGMDSVDPATWSVGAERVEQSLEEVVELGSGLALLTAVILRLLGLLDAYLRQPEQLDTSETCALPRAAPSATTPPMSAH